MIKVAQALAAIAVLMASTAAASAQDRTERLLQQLSDAPGPSGFEEAVRAIMVREMKPLARSIRYDGLGSVIADEGGEGPTVMIDAHMDELGGVVRRTTPDGFLSMQMLGGWLDQALAGQPLDHPWRQGAGPCGYRHPRCSSRDAGGTQRGHASIDESFWMSVPGMRPVSPRWVCGRVIRWCRTHRSRN